LSDHIQATSVREERRPHPRRRTLLGGIVTFGEGACVFDCSIRNLSESGAKIVCAKGVLLPPRFHLIILRDRLVCEAQLSRRQGDTYGVAFKKRLPLSEITDPKLGHLAQLWLSRAGR